MEDFLSAEKKYDIIIIGGLGHIGLPLGIVFAQKGLKVCLFDIDQSKANMVMRGIMPFIEHDSEPILKEVLLNGNLKISLDEQDIAKAKNIIITLGTTMDNYHNPKTKDFLEIISGAKKYFDSSQTIILRSTVYPDTCNQVLRLFGGDSNSWNIAYCPERIVQGYAIRELTGLPQIVAGLSEKAIKNASDLFKIISPKIIKTSVKEAELAKLFSNAFRYIQFATANQFYMVANKFGVDYNKIRYAMKEGYERANDLPGAGLTAGPCLLKDTMQLVAFDENKFPLGHAAMVINESIPNVIVDTLKKKHDLSKVRVGILGMAFKAEIDDTRDSLSYKLVKILKFNGAEVYCSDEFAKNKNFVSKEEVIINADIIIIGVPHSNYKELSIPNNIEVVDLWGILNKNDFSKNEEKPSETEDTAIKYPFHRELENN